MSLPVAILSGGMAKRLMPLTEKIPKALIDINGEPFIMHQLRLLRSQNINSVVICAGYLGEMIQDFVGDGKELDMQVEYSFDGQLPLGTGGALQKALPLLDKSFFVLYGDSYLGCDFKAVEDAFTVCEKKGLMTVFHNAGQWDNSNILFLKDRIVCYDKLKPTTEMHYIDYGLGVLNKKAFLEFADKKSFDLSLVYQKLIANKQLAGFEVKQRFFEIGSPAGLEETRAHLSKFGNTNKI